MKVTAQLLGADAAAIVAKATPRKAKIAMRAAMLRAAKDGKNVAKKSLTRKRLGLLGKSLGEKIVTREESVGAVIGPRTGFRTIIGKKIGEGRKTRFEAQQGGKAIFERTADPDATKRHKGKKWVGLEGAKGVKVKAAKGVKEGDFIAPTRYAHLIEKGHKKGKGKGAARAFPFLKPARDHSAKTAPGIIKAELKARIGG